MRRPFPHVVFFCCAFLLLPGCATIVSRYSYPVTIRSNPSQAEVTITDIHGDEVYKGVTPAVVTLNSGSGFFRRQQYTIAFNKDGYCSSSVTVTPSLNGWYWGNLVFGGLAGFLVVDPATGAMWRLPDNVDLNLVAEVQQTHLEGQAIQVVSLDNVPLYQRNTLVALESAFIGP